MFQLSFGNRRHVTLRRAWLAHSSVSNTNPGIGDYQRSFFSDFCGTIPPSAMGFIQPP
jgi:hypothetical protein